MTSINFNKKWSKYLEEGFYGLSINNLKVIEYLDKEFSKEIENNSKFSYSQIKIKFGLVRIYANSDKVLIWEDKINELMHESI